MVNIKYVGGPGEHSAKAIETITQLQKEIFGQVHEPVPYSYWWIAYEGSKPVGFAALHRYSNRPDTCFLALCGVIKSARGNGLQRRLIKVRIRKAIKLGAERVISYTTPCNAPSANNLIAHGFRVYVPRYEWGLKNAIYFRRFL